MKKVKKPIIKDYCRPFLFDDKFVSFDSKKYAKDAKEYIDYLHVNLTALANSKETPLKISKQIYNILNT